MQLSMLIGKPVVSPVGEDYGYVTDARLSRDFKTISCLICADSEEEEFFLPLRAILFADDAVIAGRRRIQTPTGVPSPIGKEAYSHTGEYLGAVCDLLFGKGSEAVLVISEQGVRTTAPTSLAKVGEHVIVYPDAETKARAAKSRTPRAPAKPREKRPPTPRKTSPAPAPVMEEPPAPTIEPAPVEEEPLITVAAEPPAEAPARPQTPPAPIPAQSGAVLLLNRTNLLGRRVKRSVFDEHGIPVAVAGERITPAILSRARKCNRLLQLTVNTLTTLY